MADDAPRQHDAKRSLLVTIAVLLLAAIAFWGSSRLAWVEVPPGQLVDGHAVDSLTGDDVAVWLVRMAVLALAAVAGVLALPDVLRRVLGAGLALAGLLAVWFTLNGGAYEIGWSGSLPGYDGSGEPVRTLTGPVTAIAGAAFLLTSGALLAVRGHRMPRLGAKYSAPGGKTPAKDADADLWRALSDGEDPTSGP